MTDSEDRDGGHARNRFEQHGDFSSAALDAVLGRGLVAEREREQPRLDRRRPRASRGRRSTAVASRLPPPTVPKSLPARHDELRSAVARGVTAHGDEGDDDRGKARLPQALQLVDPVHGACRSSARRAAGSSAVADGSSPLSATWIAQNTASGVAGDPSTTRATGGTERADGFAQRLAGAEGQHERRLADGFRPVDGAVLAGVREEVHGELLGHLREARAACRCSPTGSAAALGRDRRSCPSAALRA